MKTAIPPIGAESFLAYNLLPGTKQVLATTAIGENYLARWELLSLPGWLSYAKKNDIGILVAVENLVPPEDEAFKNGAWQKMLLPQLIREIFPSVERVCLLDTDIVVSPRAPNIFDVSPSGQYSVVSLEKNLPFDVVEARRRVSFLRRQHYSSNYPLDSLILADAAEQFRQQGLPPKDDFFCSGLIVCDIGHAEQLANWFFSVPTEVERSAVAWEQTHLNHWVQGEAHNWLPYRFQALWHYEMAWNHPHLYELGDSISHNAATRFALETALWNNHFLHFAGSWFESSAWEAMQLIPLQSMKETLVDYETYLRRKIVPRNLGKIIPIS